MSTSDPFMHGLGPAQQDPPPTAPTEKSRTPPVVEDPAAARADRLAEVLSNPQRSHTPAVEEGPAYSVEPGYDTQTPVGYCEVPPGAYGTMRNKPFSDFNSAQHEANRMAGETGDEFWVRALAPTQFVVVPSVAYGSRAVSRSEDRTAVESKEYSYQDKAVGDLTLADFPPDHPVHRCGLSKYKRYLKAGFKFKPAYRSMWPLLALIIAGLFMYTFPIRTLSLLPPDTIEQLVTVANPEKLTVGVQYLGLMFAVIAAGKAFWQRHYRRYMLMPGYAKHEEGIVARTSTKIAYTNIVNYDVRQGFIGRLLNYGTLELSSAGSDGSEIAMMNVLHPKLVEIVLEGKMLEAKRAQ